MTTRATIYDVARVAGVATSTVSRSFSSPTRVSRETRGAVLAAAEDLGYRPRSRRRVGAQRNRTLGLVVPDVTNPFYFEVFRGAEHAARTGSVSLTMINAAESPQREYDRIQSLAGAVDGFLLLASRLPDRNVQVLAAQRPVVLVNREVSGVPSASIDQRVGSAQIIDHLAGLGHEHVVYVAGPKASWTVRERMAGLGVAAASRGIKFESVGPFHPTARLGSRAADAALRTGATAVIAHNDLLALGILERLESIGVQVPTALSLVGFDDIFAARICRPTLTTLGGPDSTLGRLAVEHLAALTSPYADLSPPTRRRLMPRLRIGNSTARVRRDRG